MRDIRTKIVQFIDEVIAYDVSVIKKQLWAKIDRIDVENKALCNQYLLRQYLDILLICNNNELDSKKKQMIIELKNKYE